MTTPPAAVRLSPDALTEIMRSTLRQTFSRQLAACAELRDLSLQIAQPWGGKVIAPGETADALLAMLFARASNTNWAVLELSKIGFGDQALMLERSLFEDMVDAHWITVEPALAAQRYEQHHEHGRMIFSEAARHHPEQYDPASLPVRDAARRKKLDDRFGRYGDKSWTGLNIHARVAAIEHLWPDDVGRRHLHFFRRIVHRYNNNQLHVSAQALNRMVRQSTSNVLSLKSGPDTDAIEPALFASFWLMSGILGLVLHHFEFTADTQARAEALYEGGIVSFSKLSDAELDGVGRNDPCPCGSGKKFKRCHGR